MPLLIFAIVAPLLIAHCGMGRAAARTLSRRPARWHPGAASRHAVAPSTGLPSLDLGRIRLEGDRYVAHGPDGRTLELTFDARLQRRAEQILRQANLTYGAAVFISVPDGRVLAMAGRSTAEPERSVADLVLRPWAPAASVFKVVTSAALLAGHRITAERRVCYHGGQSGLRPDNLVDRPRLDRRCGTLATALGRSTNSIVAKLAHRYLDPQTLERYARAFGFNARVARTDAFPLEVTPSPAEMPDEDLEFARTAAGFWHVFLSPLHGARIASTFANSGAMVAPRLIERVREPDGTTHEPATPAPEQVIPETVARTIGRMMVGTTRFGTARRAFLSHGRRALPYDVAGKTGSLSRAHPYTHYNWFVGFAPAHQPRIAFGVLVGTDGRGVKAAEVARDVLRQARLEERSPRRVMLAAK